MDRLDKIFFCWSLDTCCTMNQVPVTCFRLKCMSDFASSHEGCARCYCILEQLAGNNSFRQQLNAVYLLAFLQPIDLGTIWKTFPRRATSSLNQQTCLWRSWQIRYIRLWHLQKITFWQQSSESSFAGFSTVKSERTFPLILRFYFLSPWCWILRIR